MSRQQFDAALAEAICRYPSGAHEGWKADFGALDLPGVRFSRVRITGNPASLIEAHGKSTAGKLLELEVVQGLTRFWDEFVFRADPKDHFLSVGAESIILEEFTVHDQHYVSIKIIVDISTKASTDHKPQD